VKFIDILPEIAERLIRELPEELAKQIPTLRIIELCPCQEEWCATFYAQEGQVQRTVACSNSTNVDVRDGVILGVELYAHSKEASILRRAFVQD